MGIIHVVNHAHEYIMSFQVFPHGSPMFICLKVPSGSLPLHLSEISEHSGVLSGV